MKAHHWNGTICQSLGWSLWSFEARFGNERDLLAQTLERLNAKGAA